MRTLVTGASGFIGGHVVRALLVGGAWVRAFNRTPEAIASLPGDVEFALGDICDRTTDAKTGLEATDEAAPIASKMASGSPPRRSITSAPTSDGTGGLHLLQYRTPAPAGRP